MAIGLINTYSTLNLGDAAIYSAFRHLLAEEEILACVPDQQPDRNLGITFLCQPPRHCQSYVSVGGDIFNNSREWLFTRAFLRNIKELQLAPSRTILFGQSIPRSCHGTSFFLLRQSLEKLAAVCVRDADSQSRLRRAGVQSRLSFDAAFVLQANEIANEYVEQRFRTQGIKPSSAAAVSVRMFDSHYLHSNQRFLETMTVLCKSLATEGRIPVVMIQSKAYGADNDLEIARTLQQRVPSTTIFDPFMDGAPVPSWQVAMAVFSMVDLIVAVRFHTAVLALAAGRVPYHIHYSNKGRDLCQRLGLPGCDLNRFNPETAMPSIIATRHHQFDHRQLRSRVSDDFHWCLSQLATSQSLGKRNG